MIVKFLKAGIGLFPLTLQGLITLIITTICLSVFGYGSMDLVVFSLAICALSILIFCLFCSVISGVFIQRRIQNILQDSQGANGSIEVEAGFPNESGFSIPTINLLPLVKLSWEITYPDFVETRNIVDINDQLIEDLIPQKRCLTDAVTRRFTVSDVLGLCRYSWLQSQNIRCMALPQTNSIKALPLLRSLTSEDGIPNPSGDPEGDRMEIRPYSPGDSIRNIMWKVYARNRQLNVRLAEKSLFHSKRTVAYLLSSAKDEPASAIARMALESGALGEDWIFAADGTNEPCEILSSALEAISRSRSIKRKHSYGLDRFLTQSVCQSGTHCVVFAAAELAPWIPKLKHTISFFPGQFSLVFATDGVRDDHGENLWKKLLFKKQPDSVKSPEMKSSREDLRKLLTEFGQLVESVLVIDRKTGFSFDKSLRKI
ncbi:MAG: hypothetical protein CMQ41_05205 [Gammaproteobacteria bacterium]|nr:hypothetical protein [Gammaproteobacteria bacterium]